jgi:hypothetical protein
LLYRPSLRAFPKRLPEVEYPSHFDTRVAYPNGVITFGSTQWILSNCVAGERVGLEPCEDGRWRVYFGWVAIGLLDLKRATDRGNRQFGRLTPIADTSRRRRRPPYGR